MTAPLYLYILPTQRGQPTAVLAHDMPLRFDKRAWQPLYSCALPDEMRDRSLDEMLAWWRMGTEYGTLPPRSAETRP